MNSPAIQTCSEAREKALAAGNIFLAAQATEGLALAQYHQGRLRQSAQSCQQVVALAEQYSGTKQEAVQLPLAAAGYIELAGICREWNDLDAAARHLDKGIALCQRWGVTQTLVEAYVAESRLRQALGDMKGAFESLHKAEQVPHKEGPYSVTRFRLAIQRARLNLSIGEVEKVARWAHSLDDAVIREKLGRPMPTSLREALQTMLARVHLAQGEAEKALAVLESLYAPAEATGRFGQVIEICLLKALVLQVQGNTAVALASLEQSLALAEPEGYVRVYLDEGKPVIALLRLALSHGIAPTYINRLLATFSEEEIVSPAPLPPCLPTLVEPLTRRERQVLQLIYEGYSNREIAERLVIALNTVKRHTSSIYGKLGVNSRTQALARARELGLIPSSP